VATKNHWEIQNEAAAKFDAESPKAEQPKYPLADANFSPSQIRRHSEGRMWIEIANGNVYHGDTKIELYVTINEVVHRLTIKPSELTGFAQDVEYIALAKAEIDTAKAKHAEAEKAWHQLNTERAERRQAFIDAATEEWEKSNKPKRQEGDDFDEDDDFDPDEDNDEDDDE
jgi:hypothetical protein